MNVERINQYIADLKLYDKNMINMANWQILASGMDTPSLNLEELHVCGNKACAAGYLALTEQFKKAGGSFSGVGMPQFMGLGGVDSFSAFFDIPHRIANAICLSCDNPVAVYFSKMIGKSWSYWERDDLIKIMEYVRDNYLESKSEWSNYNG